MAAAQAMSAASSIEEQLRRRMSEKYHPPNFRYEERPSEKQDYFLVLDFEADKRDEKGSRAPEVMEIIEFPVLKVNARTLQIESTFHTYVQPVIHKELNPLITQLTGITQEMVDGQPTLNEALAMLDEWMRKERLLEKDVNSCFVTCGD